MFNALKLRQLRKELGLTQIQLDEAIGLTKKTIANLENGCYQPSLQRAYKIAKFFNLTIDDFIKEEE